MGERALLQFIHHPPSPEEMSQTKLSLFSPTSSLLRLRNGLDLETEKDLSGLKGIQGA